MGRVVIACYRPKSGKKSQLHELMKDHLRMLRDENLVTDRCSIMMEAEDGTVLEVFEWKSKDAIVAAHTNPNVLTMWKEYAEVCDYIPVSTLKEAEGPFSEFAPLNLLGV